MAITNRAAALAFDDWSASSPGRHQARPDRLAARLAQAIAEVLVRARPAGQLDGVASPAVVRLLERRADPPVLATTRAVPRPVVKSLRVYLPRPGAVEACAVICVGSRHRAIAFRLEGGGERWTCVAVQVG